MAAGTTIAAVAKTKAAIAKGLEARLKPQAKLLTGTRI